MLCKLIILLCILNESWLLYNRRLAISACFLNSFLFYWFIIHFVSQYWNIVQLRQQCDIDELLIGLCSIENQRHRSITLFKVKPFRHRVINFSRFHGFVSKEMMDKNFVMPIFLLDKKNITFEIIDCLIDWVSTSFVDHFIRERVKGEKNFVLTKVFLDLRNGYVRLSDKRQHRKCSFS